MTGKAASLVDQAKSWAANYGAYPNGQEGAVLTAPLRVRAAWDANDADGAAAVFAENGSMLVGDEQLRGREEIRAYLAKAFEGPYRGTKFTEEPVHIGFLAEDVAIAVTEGGIVPPGAAGLEPDERVRAVWVVAKRDGDWQAMSHQTCPLQG